MKNIKLGFWGLLLALTALWLLADTFLPQPFTYFSFRAVLVQYSGVIAFGAMSVAMLLALRFKWLERPFNGLDKMYRLHKWLGIAALVAAIVHWWWVQGTKWMVAWGWLVRPPRRPGAGMRLGPAGDWLRSQRGTAEMLGEWAFYAALILIVLALLRRFPYHLFKKTHKWLAPVYLVLAYHAVILAKVEYWTQPMGWAIGTLAAGGGAAALLVLLHRVGAGRKVQGVIESLIFYPELRVHEIAILVQDGWPGHAAGQFAFVTSRTDEGAHPYTIASAWDAAARRIVFIVKELGDHTGRLREHLQVGMAVAVEGPYGCFDFSDSRPCQIWIGAGIGITPFVARMKHLARTPGAQEIHLFHPTADYAQAAIDKLTADARAAKVHLHVLVDARDGLLTPERIRAAVPQWRAASLWYCGPAGLGTVLREDFLAQGLDPADFHQEWFQLR
ncbi:MAG TPA: ferric reductase-like transmembrane domain-containing protein [Noviherbaspirillum sp.]|nr:ferric reductase-like transmembrane domain-containing protein [Noviherbaspirillum sp.]